METNYIYVAIYVATHVWRPILMKSVWNNHARTQNFWNAILILLMMVVYCI
jgi:hypothetical protein